ncbi:MAG TPA: class I tRNA ligase family protein, partial [Micromonosporaceae bacterium]|nr:class I tRNA ligase family protein [Micromonosporaceae bacterium]
YDHTGALHAAEAFFWRFCDDYLELVKNRAYGSGEAARSARAALHRALHTQLRLFAPFLPYATEEAWSWLSGVRAAGAGPARSVHRAAWPTGAELAGGCGDPMLLSLAGAALGQIRRAKSQRQLSMRAPVRLAEVSAPATTLDRLAPAAADLRAAGGLADLRLHADERAAFVVTCTF